MKLSSQADDLQLVGYGADVSAMQRIAAGEQLADVATRSGAHRVEMHRPPAAVVKQRRHL